MTTTATAPAAPFAPRDGDLSARMRLLGLTELPQPPAGGSSVLARVRAVCPRRALSWTEAERIAERQAGILRRELGPQAPALPTSALLDLPFLSVTHRDGFPTSGMALKTSLGWVVVIKGDEPTVRQRYSLAHEIKHIIDDELMAELPAGLYRATKLYSAQERAERVADRFAAALLMPKPLILRDWSDRLQDIPVLARRYNVSRLAMEIRLRQLGLLQATPRCAPATKAITGDR
ncbi:MAG: ImmA/IrrE family metallo-endopeptidase [Solirubrobacteraceae bacterium]